MDDLGEDASRIRPAGMLVEAVPDPPRALLGIHDHELVAERALVSVGVLQLDRAAEEAMPLRRAAGTHARQLDVDHGAAVQADEPPDRTGEAQGLGAPAHVLGERESLDETPHDLGQHLRRRMCLGVGLDEDEPVAADELVRRTVVPPREARTGLGDLTAGTERDRLGRPAVHEQLGGLRLGNTLREHGDPARRHERSYGRRREAMLDEEPLDERRSLRERGLAGARRQLLAADLDQEGAHVAGGSTIATCACATLRARLRTRAMNATRSVTEIAPRASSRLNACEHFRTWS